MGFENASFDKTISNNLIDMNIVNQNIINIDETTGYDTEIQDNFTLTIILFTLTVNYSSCRKIPISFTAICKTRRVKSYEYILTVT